MKPDINLSHVFVEAIPELLQERTLYVSIKFATVVHKCCCGCGSEVVTPLSPTDWKLIFDGETISLHPSVGSWNLPCQSHYWIQQNRAVWAARWSQDQIAATRASDAQAKSIYYGKVPVTDTPATAAPANAPVSNTATMPPAPEGFWQKLLRWFWPG